MANCTQCGKRIGMMPGVCAQCLDAADPSWRDDTAQVRSNATRAPTMAFRNPANGYVESRAHAWVGTLLLGGLYLLGIGLWAPFLVWVAIAIVALGAFGAAAVAPMLVVNVAFAAMTPSLVRTHYLRKGWVEVPAAANGNNASA
jgi:hypothetical protein